MSKVAVLGYGTVGSGVVEVLRVNAKEIARKAKESIEVKYVLDLREFPGDPVMEVLTHDFQEILNDPEVSVVAEVMGGLNPAYEFSKAALTAGKSVCTSNKQLVEKHGAELIRIAKEHRVNYLFEASVGGGIPILRSVENALTAEVLENITGIINGTTNYMLTRMYEDGAAYQDVLREAQEKGYAERNPEADVEGWDACRKIAILSSLVSGKRVDHEEIHTEGISGITLEDMAYARKIGCKIKLLASSRQIADSRACMVAPFLIDAGHPLYHVDGVYNAVYVHGNMLGDAMFYGQGAGKLPTASAVVGDIIDLVKHPGESVISGWTEDKLTLARAEDVRRRFLVRLAGTSVPAGCTAIDAGIDKETGCIAGPMTESELAKLLEGYDVKQTLRMEEI